MKRGLLASAVCALALAACNQGENTVRIGYVGPLTGDASAYGVDTLNGARIAVDEINAKGGMSGKKVELIAEDGRCNGADAANAAQKLINVDKVVAIIGGQCSSETLAIAPIAEAANVVVISPISSSPDVTDAGEYIFRVYPSDAYKGDALVNYMKKAGFKKLAIISENTDFCQGIRSTVKSKMGSDASVVFDEVVDQGTKDYRSLMTRLKDVDFDLFLVNSQSDATGGEMMKQFRALGMTQQAVGSDTSDSATLGQSATEAVEGMRVLSVPALSEEQSAAASFATVFRQRYDDPKFSMFFSALSHDATTVLLTSIAKAGTGEPLKDELLSIDSFEGLVGNFHFDKNGDVVGIPYAMKAFKNGKLEQAELIELN